MEDINRKHKQHREGLAPRIGMLLSVVEGISLPYFPWPSVLDARG